MKKILCFVLLLGGCSGVPTIPNVTPYKIDIQQGNYVTQDMVAKLKPGMTRAQVRFVLGTPLVADMFHKDRWDYVYVYRKAGKVTEHRSMTVVFKDDKLARLEGDVVPAKPAPTKPKPKAKASPNGAISKPVESVPAGKPAVTAAPSQPDATNPSADTGEPAGKGPKESESGNSKTSVDKANNDAQKDDSPEEKGFFGRMLDKLGF